MTVNLTPVVDAMARAAVDKQARQPGVFDTLDPVARQQIRQEMLDLLIPALPTLEEQVDAAITAKAAEAGL